jgi:hypothetical protein
MSKKIFMTLVLTTLVSCGDNSPFDEDYWEEPRDREGQQSETDIRSFSANLEPLTANVGNLDGTFSVTVTENDAQSVIQLNEVPQSLMQAQKSFTSLSCEAFRNIAFPDIVNPTGEFKAINTNETASRDALIAELNQSFPGNGDNTNLEGRRVIVSAFILNNNSPNPQNATLIPIACGDLTLTRNTEDDDDDTTGGTTGGVIGGVTGTINGGTFTGGNIAGGGGTVGGVGGSIGTVDGGSIGGTIGTVDGGNIGGTTFGGTTGF